ncbi:MAG: putative dsRNA-binding protein [Solirubrobacterales bacterium]
MDADSPVSSLAALIDELPADLRSQALTHTSWVKTRTDSYKRLAFLGDSLLSLAIASTLFTRFPEVDSGGLSKIHNQAVSGVSCTEVGRELGVPAMLEDVEPKAEKAIPAEILLDGARPLPEVTEALIGACFLTFGFERVAAAVAAAFEPQIELAVEAPVDPKTALQVMLARRGAIVEYEVVGESGPDNRRVFEVAAIVGSKEVGRGSGRSKKSAEMAAAEQALKQLGDE